MKTVLFKTQLKISKKFTTLKVDNFNVMKKIKK